jgi:hypothetical protein
VKSAGADGEAWQKQSQPDNPSNKPDAERRIDDVGDNGRDDDKERPVPIFGPAGAAAELNILAKARRNRLCKIHVMLPRVRREVPIDGLGHNKPRFASLAFGTFALAKC